MFYQLQLHCASSEIELYEELLTSLGALSISFQDAQDHPILEPSPGTTPLWPEINLSALFNQEEQASIAARVMEENYSPQTPITMSLLADEDWQATFRQQIQAQRFGQQLWVCPTWVELPEPQAINIRLDPGLAFGTGAHPTTALCLQWLDQVHSTIKDKQIMDYGCGSGILGISALKLGAQHVQAIDIDPQALEATKKNAALNQITKHQISIAYPSAVDKNVEVDIILANILLAPLIELRDTFYQQLKKQGLLVVSGILTKQILQLQDAYHQHFQLVERSEQENWALLVFQMLTPQELLPISS